MDDNALDPKFGVLHLLMQDDGVSGWRFTGYYEFPYRDGLREALELIRSLHSQNRTFYSV